MPRSRYRPSTLLAGGALGLVALGTACTLIARATPGPAGRMVRSDLRPGAAWEIQTGKVCRRPLVRVVPAMGAFHDRGPTGVRTSVPHPVWLEALTAAAAALPGAPAEVDVGARKLVGVVEATRRNSGSTALWIALDRRAAGKLARAGSLSLELPLGPALAVPVQAVVDTGAQQWVWVETPNGLHPRAVTLGPKAEEFYVVDRGLTPGMRVVTDYAFLRDAARAVRRTRISAGLAAARVANRPDPWGPLPD